MKKNNLIISAAISVAFLTALTSLIQVIPIVYAYNEQDCKCTHWYINDENTVDDIFTGTGLDAHFGTYFFDYVDAWFTAGTGGTYSYKPDSPMYRKWKYQDSNYNWFGPYLLTHYGGWQEDYDIPGGPYFEYAYYKESYVRFYYDGITKARRFKGLTQNWFQNPDNPSSWWLCGSIWADVVGY